MEEEHHHHHYKSHECETTMVAEETSVESKDRGLFDFLGKKEEEMATSSPISALPALQNRGSTQQRHKNNSQSQRG